MKCARSSAMNIRKRLSKIRRMRVKSRQVLDGDEKEFEILFGLIDAPGELSKDAGK